MFNGESTSDCQNGSTPCSITPKSQESSTSQSAVTVPTIVYTNGGVDHISVDSISDEFDTLNISSLPPPTTSALQALDPVELRHVGCRWVNFVSDYLTNIEQLRVFPQVQPGFLAKLLPDRAPESGEEWNAIFDDVREIIVPGITQWNHPHFHAYFPCGISVPTLCAEIVLNGLMCIGFSWRSSPACTELEIIVLDWLAKLLKLPEPFLSHSTGGGVIQTTCSEGTLVALLTARNRIIRAQQVLNPQLSNYDVAGKLVGYYTNEAHSSVERAGLIGMLRLRAIETGQGRVLTGQLLQEAIDEDMARGFLPFFCTATLGTTGCCAFDRLSEIGPICKKYDMWLHIDAAYAGSAFICPEYRPLLDGVEHAMSLIVSPHKWLMVNFDCACMWFKEKKFLTESFQVNPIYLVHEHVGRVVDFRHWQLHLGRKFRSMKLWFVLRRFGAQALRQHIREHIALASEFARKLILDKRFELVAKVAMGLVCFHLKVGNEKTNQLFDTIEDDGRIHLTNSVFNKPEKIFYIRFVICHHSANLEHVDYALNVIRQLTDQVIGPRKHSTSNLGRQATV